MDEAAPGNLDDFAISYHSEEGSSDSVGWLSDLLSDFWGADRFGHQSDIA